MSLGIRANQPRLMALFAMAALCVAGLFAAGTARAADPAIFDVGAASANINPDTPQYPGGYGYKAGPFTKTHDDLEMRAFVVGKGDKAAAFVSGDLAGWFAAYATDKLEPYGIDHTRERIAAALNARGYNIDRKSVIVSTTHTHAAPSVVGIWGPPDAAYLKKVADAAVEAADKAAEKAKPSEIWSGVGSIRSFVWQNGQGTNHPDGFAADNDLPIMWARDPQTGATNALYANVPNHPDQFNGEDNLAFSADWPGFARRKLDELNGGTAVIAAGTLGRQEPPGSIPTYDEVIPQGQYVVNQIQRTMAKATPLTSDTIAGTEAYLLTPADNEDLLLGMNLFKTFNGACLDSEEICTIPRSTSPPYLVQETKIGTYLPSIRIGDLVYSSNPGEAFPEINDAIRSSISGERYAAVVGMSNDMLGYYYERDDYYDDPNKFGSSDFEEFNVGPDLPQDNANLARQNAATLGFATTPKTVHAPFDASVMDKVGLQWYSNIVQSADPKVNIYAGAQRSQDKTIEAPATIDWDFDDGSGPYESENGIRFSHTFPGPGTYEVTATATGSNDKTRTWTDTITIDPALKATATQKSRVYDSTALEVTTTGGSGKLIGARWTCPDGSKVDGLRVDCPGNEAGTATVVAADGAGNTATASVPVTAGPPKPVAKLKLVKLTPRSKKVKRGKSVLVKATFKNVGTVAATKAKACVSIPKKSRKGVKVKPACRSLGTIAVGQVKTAKLRVKTNGKAKAKTVITVKATASDSSKATGRMTLKTKAAKRAKKAQRR